MTQPDLQKLLQKTLSVEWTDENVSIEIENTTQLNELFCTQTKELTEKDTKHTIYLKRLEEKRTQGFQSNYDPLNVDSYI